MGTDNQDELLSIASAIYVILKLKRKNAKKHEDW